MDKLLERIESLRKDRGWSQFKLAEKSGVAQSTIATWFDENKGSLPSVAPLRRIAESFGITMQMLFAGCEPEDTVTIEITQQLHELIQKFEKLSNKQREAILNLIDSFKQDDE